MAVKKPRRTKGMSDESVKERTGKVWAEWFKILDKAGAKKWPHQEIAAYLRDEQKVGPWWGQMISVSYEQARGLREKFQKCVASSALHAAARLLSRSQKHLQPGRMKN